MTRRRDVPARAPQDPPPKPKPWRNRRPDGQLHGRIGATADRSDPDAQHAARHALAQAAIRTGCDADGLRTALDVAGLLPAPVAVVEAVDPDPGTTAAIRALRALRTLRSRPDPETPADPRQPPHGGTQSPAHTKEKPDDQRLCWRKPGRSGPG